ncbi:protein kinase domain-containing protein [Streptomyces bullii]|uniref:Protein kinase n=1 Tax=Streptomyces bullii TaxID=349910 RepID=A0ABW0UKP8_9ACTN
MSQQRPTPSVPAAHEAAALRRAGASPLRSGDPRRIGPYVPLALLGSGGMGRVYLARRGDGGTGLVAVKVIRPEYADDANFRRRFQREASVHARVRTPHTPRLCGTGFQDELLWMATEYLPGLDLAEAVREDGALPTAAVWRLVAEMGQALAGLGAAGIVHRDLKPSNVLLSVSGAYVIDFGLSKAVDASALTGTGNRVGTPAFMSPEHLREGRTDTSSDVFSLAGTLVYAATGHAPFGDGTGVDVMHRVAFEEPKPHLIDDIAATDAALGELLSACLVKEPELRPTPQELIEAAVPHTGSAVWPEPLAALVLDRQRAYEVLCGLSAADAPGDEAVPVRGEALPAGLGAPPSAVPLRSGETRTGSRRKPVLAVTAGITLCAVAAGVFVLTRPDARAASPDARTTVEGAVPEAASGSPPPTSASGRKPASGKSADGAARPGGNVSRPEATDSPGTGRRSASPSAPGARPSTPAEESPTPSSPPAPTPTPPWITDCTHYSGNGRTRSGDSGKRVRQVQCILTKRGYAAASRDGESEFGAGTESAVRSFQGDRGLTADGVVDHATWAALRGND